MSKEAASVGIRIKAGSIMRRHAPRGLKSSDVTRIPLRHGHPPHDARMEFQRSSEPRQAARERGRRLGPARAAGCRRGALAMRWREWAGAVAGAIILLRALESDVSA